MCPIMMPVRGNYAEMLGTIVHIGDADNPTSVVAAFDTLAEVSAVNADLVTKNTKENTRCRRYTNVGSRAGIITFDR